MGTPESANALQGGGGGGGGGRLRAGEAADFKTYKEEAVFVYQYLTVANNDKVWTGGLIAQEDDKDDRKDVHTDVRTDVRTGVHTEGFDDKTIRSWPA